MPMQPADHSVAHIALYGSLRAAAGMQARLGLARLLRPLGPCRVPGRLVDLGRYPGLVPGDGAVLAELYAIQHPRALAILDRFEDCNPARPRRSLYRREAMRLIAPDTLSWVYRYNRPAGAWPVVADGDWLAHLARRGFSCTQGAR